MVDIRQEINFINQPITADSSGIASLDASDYSDALFYFEVVALVASGTCTVGCYDTGDAGNETTVSVTATGYTLYRSVAFTPTAGAREYIVDVSGGTGPSIKSARIVILQSATDITDTQTQIEIGSYEIHDYGDILAYPYTEPKYWKYESAKWDPTPTFTFGGTRLSENGSNPNNLLLQEASDAAFTSDVATATSITGITQETPFWVESAAFTPKNNYYYRLLNQCTKKSNGGTLFNAKIIATQDGQSSLKSSDSPYSLAQYNGVNEQLYQSFQAKVSSSLNICEFKMYKVGSPTGNAVARLYDHTGAFGTASEPTGAPLATSDNFDVSTLNTDTDGEWITFNFSTPYSLVASSYYCIVCEYTGGTVGNRVLHRAENIAAVHPGNGGDADDASSPSYTAQSALDIYHKIVYNATKLQPEYLMINDAQTGTGNQEFLTDYISTEWNNGGGGSLTYYHEQSTTNAADNTKLEYDLDGTPTIVTNSSVTGVDLTRSSALTMPSTDTLDTDIITSTGTIYGDRILVDVYLAAAAGGAFGGLGPMFAFA